MNKNIKKNVLMILLPGLFIFFQIYLVFVKNYQVLDYARYVNEFPQPLVNEDGQMPRLNQTFRTPGPLTRIDVMLGTYAEEPKDGALQLGIYDDKRCLFLKNDPAGRVKDNRFHTFLIPRGKVPRGSYSLELRFLPGERQERLATWTSRKDSYPYGDFFVNGKKQEGDMTFRVYYQATLWQARANLLEKIPVLWFGRGWLLIGFLLIIPALNFLFYSFVRNLVERTL